MIVGEFPSVEDERMSRPFAGQSGAELGKMLHEAGFMLNECYITYASKTRPRAGMMENLFVKNTPASRIATSDLLESIRLLSQEIEAVRPRVIIALGEVALWALTGKRSITKQRASHLPLQEGMTTHQATVIPTYSPGSIMRMWGNRMIAVQDIRRAKRVLDAGEDVPPTYNFTIRPGFAEAMRVVEMLTRKVHEGAFQISVDIETRHRHIACVGLAWSKVDAICIPLMDTHKPAGYWDAEEELALIRAISFLLTHPNARIIGQNFLYDDQYFARYWGIAPIPEIDTMIAQGVLFPGIPKGLDFLSSLYCEHHVYWKDESKEWDPKLGEEQLWIYNCKDAVITYEVAQVLTKSLGTVGLSEQLRFEMDMFEPILITMLRGVRVHTERKRQYIKDLQEEIARCEEYFESIIPSHTVSASKGAKPWFRSPQQQAKLFYDQMLVKPVLKKGTGRRTCDDDALTEIAKREPLLSPLLERLAEYRSLGVFLSTFAQTPLDWDNRLRCSYNPVGTETFRLSSSSDAFGFGTNLQNIPRGD
jgi:uracil-DNA glycosylase family 4